MFDYFNRTTAECRVVPNQGGTDMPDKSPQKPSAKKVGKSLKEKRRDKKDKQTSRKGLSI